MAKDIVEDGASCFIALNFTEARLRVQERLKELKVPFSSIYGGQRDDERQHGIDEFQANRIHVMVGMAEACGVALSLHDEHHERPRVSLISPGWSASTFLQTLGRIRRVGGTMATQKILLCANSVEERVAKAIERKLANLSALNDGDMQRRLTSSLD
jgi:demethoxyubiquinone hydroxylase (CLK1/Coq7/Cat5 family)